MDGMGVDIIVSIYNAYDELCRCVDSLKRWTDFQTHRLVLINDCSTDKRITPYLEKLNIENCIVIQNKENKGFPENVNTGMAQSETRDVILLNTDTIVSRNWVGKMLECAYRDPQTATVTPLSNNAMLCSVPYFFQNNKLPDGYDIDDYASLVERHSLKKYPAIPVANGFCMLIKREVIKNIGYFDAKTFQRGYGEENDFCFRASEAGYHHIMCDDTFVMHTGTCSFGSEDKKRLAQEHEKILEKRYPDIVRDVQLYIRDRPADVIAQNIRMWTLLDDNRHRKTILYLLHVDFREGSQDYLGGTQLHVKDLVNGLRTKYNIVVAARNLDYLNVTFYTAQKELFFQFYIGPRSLYEKFRSKQYGAVYGKILDAFSVSCVHVHHVIGLSLELFYEAEKRQIPVFSTLHDHYFICPNITMLDEQNRLCTLQKETDCALCLKQRKKIADTLDYITIWRKQHKEALMLSQKVFVPSESTKKLIQAYYPDLEKKLMVMEHGSKPCRQEEKESKNTKKSSFRVAFLGALSEAKGLGSMMELVRKGADIDWYLFGYFGREIPELEQQKNFHDMGLYERDDLPESIRKNEIDLICILPLCAETFCYTLSEALLTGIPVLVTDAGALGERVRKMDCGWVMPYRSSSDEILEKIRSLKKNKNEYRKKKQNVCSLHLKTTEEMCREYDSIYKKASAQKCGYRNIDHEWLAKGCLTMQGNQKGGMEFQERLAEAERQLMEIHSSTTYRILLKIAGIVVPFRRQIRRWLRV